MRESWRIGTKFAHKFFNFRGLAFHFDQYAGRGVQHITGEPQCPRQVVNEGAKADTLHNAAYTNLLANGMQHFNVSDDHHAARNMTFGVSTACRAPPVAPPRWTAKVRP